MLEGGCACSEPNRRMLIGRRQCACLRSQGVNFSLRGFKNLFRAPRTLFAKFGAPEAFQLTQLKAVPEKILMNELPGSVLVQSVQTCRLMSRDAVSWPKRLAAHRMLEATSSRALLLSFAVALQDSRPSNCSHFHPESRHCAALCCG